MCVPTCSSLALIGSLTLCSAGGCLSRGRMRAPCSCSSEHPYAHCSLLLPQKSITVNFVKHAAIHCVQSRSPDSVRAHLHIRALSTCATEYSGQIYKHYSVRVSKIDPQKDYRKPFRHRRTVPSAIRNHSLS
ncbi:hypothetical protein DE146DRAFT_462004 [Phaeosphaeria sp. MPI-PUGE-AT-0046c]|nr:hypothetical protein DE146DRAFT_462004 [Phaeosphaeria sp. MPI-PUGE-AT-0046c]